MNLKNILFLLGGAFVGWKVGERFVPGTVGEVGGAVAGGAVGYWVAKKV